MAYQTTRLEKEVGLSACLRVYGLLSGGIRERLTPLYRLLVYRAKGWFGRNKNFEIFLDFSTGSVRSWAFPELAFQSFSLFSNSRAHSRTNTIIHATLLEPHVSLGAQHPEKTPT